MPMYLCTYTHIWARCRPRRLFPNYPLLYAEYFSGPY